MGKQYTCIIIYFFKDIIYSTRTWKISLKKTRKKPQKHETPNIKGCDYEKVCHQ